MLADLVLHVGSVVSTHTLIEDLWGSGAPPTAEAVVQNAIHRLRTSLGRDVIETRSPGYLLRVDPGAVDARRFERLAHDARPLPPAERSEALRDALALWRGPAFADLAFESFLQAEIARLDELRLTALEDRIEAEVELGRHDDVIADAGALGAQHRDRERLCRLLMLALHRAGRQQEALDAYEATRRALDEQWGLEPSEETRALQHMILTQDPAIAPTQPVSGADGAVRRPVSLLLAEPLVDDELELEAAGAILREVRRVVADVAERHGGSLSPESGVELVAAFGADGAHEDDVVRAGRAAVEIREILRGRELEARLAVGTGTLLVESARPVLVGATVGRVRRALHDADASEIQLTAHAARLGGDAFELDADGRLLGVRPGRPGPGVGRTSLVGRTDELAELRAAFERVVETRAPAHAVVVGEAGIGKSRLVAAFLEELPAAVLAAACTPYGEGITFLPLRELAERAAVLDEDAPVPGELDSADAALGAARSLLEHFAASGPAVVVLDDLHWAVPTFLDVVEYVVRAVDGPLLVVSVGRPELLERRPAWGGNALVLGPLAGDDARRLVDALPERAALDEEDASAILAAAEGVPLFLEQLAAHTAESGLADEQVPATLDGLLASRIDALEPGERAVLSRAAVVGRAFSRSSLGHLIPETEARGLDGRLASLERRRLVRPRGADLEFAHPLVRRAAYDAIGREERADLHEAVARWLERGGGADEVVGAHLERSALDTTPGHERDARSRDASTRLARAGRQALLAFDHAAAANLLERAAGLLAFGEPSRLELECGLGHALKGLGELERAVELLESVEARAASAGERRLQLRARVELVYPMVVMGSMGEAGAVKVLDDAMAVLGDGSDTYGAARVEMAYAAVLQQARRNDAARLHARRAEDLYERLGIRGSFDGMLVLTALWGTTGVDEGVRLCREAMARSPERPRGQAYLRVYLAILLALRGDLEAARDAAVAARAELEQLGEETGLHTTAGLCLGSAEALAGDWKRARETFRRGLDYARDRPSHRQWHAFYLARLGEVALACGDPADAVALAEAAAALAVAGDLETDVWWRRVAARGLGATGHPRKAARLAREAVALADGCDDLVLRGEARLDLAEVLLGAGSRARAAAAVREGLALLDRKGAVLPAENGRVRFAGLVAETQGGGATTVAPPGDGD